MGLDIYDQQGNSERVGSYSQVHYRRKLLLQAAAVHMKERLKFLKARQVALDAARKGEALEEADDDGSESDMEEAGKGSLEADEGVSPKLKLETEDSLQEAEDEDLDENIEYYVRECESAIKMLEAVCHPGRMGFLGTSLSYQHFPSHPPEGMVQQGLTGVFWFVNFSDSEGTYSPGMVSDIALAFKTLKPIIDQSEDDFDDLASFFTTAASNGSTVRLS